MTTKRRFGKARTTDLATTIPPMKQSDNSNKYQVDTKRLEPMVGMELTYKQLCNVLEWKEYKPGSNSRNAQFKALSNVINYHTVGKNKGKRYVIDSIKKGLDLEQIKATLNETKLVNIIAKSILEQLYIELVVNPDDFDIQGSWFVTNRTLAKRVGLNNKSYDYVKQNKKRFAEQYQLDYNEMNDTFTLNEDYINTKLRQALNLLQNKIGLISHTQAFMLHVKQSVIDSNSLIELNHVDVATTEETMLYPSLDVIEWIRVTAIPSALREMKYRTLSQLNYNLEDKKRFYNTVLPNWINTHSQDTRVDGLPKYPFGVQTLVGVQGVYMCHRIGFNTEVIKESYQDFLLTQEERDILSQLFSSLGCDDVYSTDNVRLTVCNSLNTNLINRHHKAINGIGKESTITIRASETYVETGKKVNHECHGKGSDYKYFISKANNEPKQTRVVLN